MPSAPQRLQKHHLHPTLRARERYDAVSDRHIQQAGRSATNLNAQASAQTLREASRYGSRETSDESPSDSPDLVSQRATPAVYSGHASSRALDAPSRPPAARPDSSLAPELRKHSNASTTSSTGMVMAQLDQHIFPGTTETQMPSAGTKPPLKSWRSASQMQQTEPRLTLAHPRSVRDLGSDYTRYFNPFASQTSSANVSQQDLSVPPAKIPTQNFSTHLAPTHALSSTNLSKRSSVHSNPFRDDKRDSSANASEDDIISDTPRMAPSYPEKEEKVAILVPQKQPVRAGTPAFNNAADLEKLPFFQYMDDRFGAPCSFPLYIDQQEDDDDLHMPRWDDDRRYKPDIRERFSRENIVNTIGVVFMLIGLITVFIVLPVVSFSGTNLIPYTFDTPLDQMPGHEPDPAPWAHINNVKYPLLQNIRVGLVDPDTPSSAQTRLSTNGEPMVLVFSDEFNERNRTFYKGDDPYWFAPDIWYGATQDLEWYDPDAVNTWNGTLEIQLDAFNNHDLSYRSGMLNSWNQLCFKGGVFEVSLSLPGPAGVHGLWPGAWTMGNLGRPGHLATTDGLWPYTYNSCDVGITPNQSSDDGISLLPGQRLPNCVCTGADHPTPGTGRGAPEIDIVEVSADWGGLNIGVATQSYQVAPFDVWYYPNYDYMETPDYTISGVNSYTGGPYQQAVSTTTMLNNAWYDGKAYQKYSFEYAPGSDEDAYVIWKVGDDEMMKFDARAIGPNGNIQQRLISEEPMSLILNLGLSHSWVDVDMANLKFPTIFRIDYVRWYQLEGQEMVTCDPPGYETTEYIANHPEAYNNANYTSWSDTGYEWPKNTLMHGCTA